MLALTARIAIMWTLASFLVGTLWVLIVKLANRLRGQS